MQNAITDQQFIEQATTHTGTNRACGAPDSLESINHHETGFECSANGRSDQDVLVRPRFVFTVPLSPLAALMQRITERLASPFDPDGEFIMLLGFANPKDVGLVVTARFRMDGDDGNYSISGKVRGSRIAIFAAGDDVRVHQNGTAVATAKPFQTTWRKRRTTGRMDLYAVHLPIGREIHMWVNNGHRFGDIERRVYVVTPTGIVGTVTELHP